MSHAPPVAATTHVTRQPSKLWGAIGGVVAIVGIVAVFVCFVIADRAGLRAGWWLGLWPLVPIVTICSQIQRIAINADRHEIEISSRWLFLVRGRTRRYHFCDIERFTNRTTPDGENHYVDVEFRDGWKLDLEDPTALELMGFRRENLGSLAPVQKRAAAVKPPRIR